MIDLRSDKLTVGRSRRCDVAINDPSVSRKHVFLTVGEGKVHLQDLGSSNGTFVNGERVTTEAELYDGDALRLGDAETIVEVCQGSFETPSDSLSADQAGSIQISGTTLLPTGSSVAMLAPPLGELPGSAAPKPILEARESPARNPPLVTPPGLLERDDSLALFAEPDDKSEKITSVLPAAALADEGFPDDTEPVAIRRDLPPASFAAPAGFSLRAAALLVDALWVLVLVWASYIATGQLGGLVAVGVAAGVVWLGWGFWGTSPGKSLVGLRVVVAERHKGIGLLRSLVRLAGFCVGTLALGIGFWMVAFSPSGLALHDHLAGTRVIRRDH
jgi:uncharacterized RDD family membrane protein YckC